jgi:hypothetical protein
MEQAAFPKPSRRRILIGGATVAAAVAAVPLLRPGAGSRTRRLLASNGLTRRFLSLADAERDEWAAQVGSNFAAEGGYRLKLAGVRPLRSEGARPSSVSRQSAFVAVFDVLDGRTMAGDLIYTLRHSQYGRLPIFLTVSEHPGRMLAVFN